MSTPLMVILAIICFLISIVSYSTPKDTPLSKDDKLLISLLCGKEKGCSYKTTKCSEDVLNTLKDRVFKDPKLGVIYYNEFDLIDSCYQQRDI